MSIQTIRVVFIGTFPNASTRHIDLGLVSVRDAAIYGRARPLIEYAEGRLISSVRFVPPATAPTCNIWAITPNTTNFTGFANVSTGDLSSAIDTMGLVRSGNATGLDGQLSNTMQILDVGPLILGVDNPVNEFNPPGSWAASTKYCLTDHILDVNDHLQEVSVNGVSGGTIPVFNTSGGTTSDGTVTWTDSGVVPSGSVHLVAEVIEGVSPMPVYPASLEFTQQPTNAVHNVAFSPTIKVRVLDQNGAPYVFTPATIAIRIFGAGTLNGTFSQTQDLTTGIANFPGLSITEIANGYRVRAELYPTIVTDSILSDTFNIT